MKKFLGEFKEFAAKGNVVDLAVGVIIGGAFGKIVTSLVNDIIMPLVAIPTGKVNFTELKYTVGETVIAYGAFIQTIVDFPPAPAEPSEEVKLLTEIRDALKK